MAGPQTIQRYPVGLLPFLGIQSAGVAPSEISGTVAPTLDVLDFYTRDRIENVQIGGINLGPAIGLIGNANSGGTPAANELWLVYGVSLQTTAQAAATTGRYQLALWLQGLSSTAVTIPVGNKLSLAAGDAGSMGQWFDSKPVLFKPGDTLAVWVENYTGAAATQFFWNLTIARIRS